MSLAEELLASIGEEATVHEHPVVDSDNYFVIDPDSREITNVSDVRNTLMQGDHKSEIYTIALPRIIEGHDMILCNRVRVHFINITADGKSKNANVAELDPPTIDPKDSANVVVTWSIRREATQLAGILSFAIQYMCVTTDGDVDYEFHSDYYSDVDVKEFRDNGESSVIGYSNILEDWYQKLFGLKDSLVQSVANMAEAQKEAIARKGEETLATIPADYTELYHMADEAVRTKADAIVLKKEGEVIFVDDSSDAYLLGLNAYGNTAQVKTTGKQLLRVTKSYGDVEGAKIIVRDDGSFVITGTVSKNTSFAIGKFQAEGELILSCKTFGSANNSYMYIGMAPEDNIGWYGVDKQFTGDGTERTVYAVIIAGTYYDTTFYPMIRPASIADDAYEPYSGGLASPNPDWPQEMVSIENPNISMFGKNLLNADLLVGGTFVKNDDGTYTFTKLANSATSATCPLNLPAGDYVMSWGEVSRTCESYRVYINYADGTTQLTGLTNLGVNKLTLSTDAGIKDIRLSLASNVTTDTYVKFAWLQIEVGTEATEYEPYKAVQTITVNRTLRSLTALYWDGSANAGVKEVIRDEVDLERGLFIQRIGLATMDSGTYTAYMLSGTTGRGQLVASPYPVKNQNYNATLCNIAIRNGIALEATDHEYYENPANIVFVGAIGEDEASMRSKYAGFELLYVLDTPIESTLTEEEIANYKKLMTNYHNTTVMNDHNAHMTIKYAADTLIYLRDNQPKPTDEQVEAAIHEYVIQNGVQVPSDDHIRSIVDEVLGGIVNDEY